MLIWGLEGASGKEVIIKNYVGYGWIKVHKNKMACL